MRLVMIGITVVGFGIFVAHDQHVKKTQFAPVDARISGVNEQCYLEKVDRGLLSKTTSTSDMLGCELADLLTRTHPKWRGYDVKHKIELQLVFVSPVDGATHRSSWRLSAYPNGQPLKVGDVFPIRASKTEADRIRES